MRNLRDMDRAEVETIASGRTSASSRLDVGELGAARAELVRRDQEYAEQQEQSRRQFEIELFNSQGAREVQRKQFEQELTKQQMDHASKLAREQLDTARSAAKAARWSAVATLLAALTAVAQLFFALKLR